jgi:hypothetical protein
MTFIFTQSQDYLSEQSWKLLLRQKSEKELYLEKQREILKEIFE